MLRVAVLCLVVVVGVRGNWEAKDDPSASDLGFVMVNVTCNDKKTACGSCIKSHTSLDVAYLNVFEYTKDPYKFAIFIEDAIEEAGINFIQGDPADSFRLCHDVVAPILADAEQIPEVQRELRVSHCLDNDFAAITVPTECPRPIATVTLWANFFDPAVVGQQTLYCIP